MNDMRNTYSKMKTEDLRTLRSKKHVRLEKLREQYLGYFVKREIEVLTKQIHQIDVELTARFLQMDLF